MANKKTVSNFRNLVKFEQFVPEKKYFVAINICDKYSLKSDQLDIHKKTQNLPFIKNKGPILKC